MCTILEYLLMKDERTVTNLENLLGLFKLRVIIVPGVKGVKGFATRAVLTEV